MSDRDEIAYDKIQEDSEIDRLKRHLEIADKDVTRLKEENALLKERNGYLDKDLKTSAKWWAIIGGRKMELRTNLLHEKIKNNRLNAECDKNRDAIRNMLNELGVPNTEYPAPVANAYKIGMEALGKE